MFLLSPTGPLGYAMLLLDDRLRRARTTKDRGASAIEWVVITAMLVLIATAIFTIIYAKVKTAANAVNTTVKAP